MRDRGNTFKIFIGNLSDETTGEDLRILFEDHGTVVEADVVTDKNFGFVHMEKEEDRKAAIDALNGHILHDHDISVEASTGNRNSSSVYNKTKIFIGNLHSNTTSYEIRELFEAHGNVTEADVFTDFAFVHMESEEDARTAIESLDGTELHGLRMRVQTSRSGGRQNAGMGDRKRTKIFIGNLHRDTTSAEIRELFEAHGKVNEADVLNDIAFVHMESEDDARTAIESLDGTELHGLKMRVQMSTSFVRQNALKRTKIFIGNLHKNTTSKEIRELFEEHGKVNEADVLSDFAFVHMESEEDARTAIEALDGTELHGLRIRVQESKSRMTDSDSCYRCGRRGHWSKNCREPDRRYLNVGGRFEPYGSLPQRGYDRDRMMRPMHDGPYGYYGRYDDDPYMRRPMRDDPYDRHPYARMRDDPYDRRAIMPPMWDDPYDRPPMRFDYMRLGRRSRSPPPRMERGFGRYPPLPPPAPPIRRSRFETGLWK